MKTLFTKTSCEPDTFSAIKALYAEALEELANMGEVGEVPCWLKAKSEGIFVMPNKTLRYRVNLCEGKEVIMCCDFDFQVINGKNVKLVVTGEEVHDTEREYEESLAEEARDNDTRADKEGQ